MTCQICGLSLLATSMQWTIVHNVAACMYCGSTYMVLHYEGEGEAKRRVNKPPELMVKPEWVGLIKRFWAEEHQSIDSDEFYGWLDAHKAEWPTEVEALNAQ